MFDLHGHVIEPGENAQLRIPVGKLPSDTPIYVNAYVYRAVESGPTVLVLAGVHGDEVNGVETVRRVLQSGLFENLQRGSVIAIPVLNVYGFNNFSREVPDGKDVNRSFPGTTRGSLASRVARTLTREILPLVDFGIDYHTGGNAHYNFPQIRYTKGDAAARELAEVFAAPFTIAKPALSKSLRQTAGKLGKPILVYEGGENLRLGGVAIEKGMAGLRRVLCHHGMLAGEAPAPDRNLPIGESGWLRAARAGMFQWMKQSGAQVRKGEILGFLNDPYGQWEEAVTAPHAGYLIGHTNAPVVSMGDALFHLGR